MKKWLAKLRDKLYMLWVMRPRIRSNVLDDFDMRTNDLLKKYPLDKNDWTGKVSFNLGSPDDGRISLFVSCSVFSQSLITSIAAALDPCQNLVRWMEKVAAGDLPAEYYLGDEGCEMVFQASPIDEDQFLFEIAKWPWENTKKEQPLHMYIKTSKKQFITEFLQAWDDFLANRWDAEKWHGEDLSALDVSALRKFVEG